MIIWTLCASKIVLLELMNKCIYPENVNQRLLILDELILARSVKSLGDIIQSTSRRKISPPENLIEPVVHLIGIKSSPIG
jgi:hypothetical protein